MKRLYRYRGTVRQFGNVVVKSFEGQTLASSEKQALNNFTFQAKKILGLASNSKLTLDSKYISC